MKKKYLIAHNYGMGAVWGVIRARSVDEILTRFPLLTVFETRPSWMSWWEYRQIEDKHSYDIDDEPSGWLAEMKR